MKCFNLQTALAQKEQVKELFLNRMELRAVPSEVLRLPNLTKLDLSHNELAELPEALDQLPHLEHLILSHNPLQRLPSTLAHLEKLYLLDISHTALEAFPNNLRMLKQIRELRVSHNDLRQIPKEIAQLKYLRRLDGSHNAIGKISREIGRLSLLRVINLSHNELTRLPESIGRCQSLEDLNLGQNRLKKLPESLSDLTQLRRLKVDGNRLQGFPRSIGGCLQLRTISANKNRIKTIDSLGQLPALAHLHLNKNQLKSLPVALGNCQRLYELELADNKLKILPEIFWSLTQLSKIDISKNHITKLPRFGKSLKQLVANNNELSHLGQSLSHAPGLERLELNHNPLEAIPPYFEQLKQLTTLHFRGNKLVSTLPRPLLYLDKLTDIQGSIPQLTGRQLISFIRSCKKIDLKEAYRATFFLALTGDVHAFSAAPWNILIQALNFPMPDVQYAARLQLLHHQKPTWQEQPLRRTANLSILGKTFFDLEELSNRLKKLGIVFSKNITSRTTHVLLGYRPVEFTESLNRSMVFLNEKALSQFLDRAENRYLVVQKDSRQLQSLKELLLNPRAANIGLAIQLLKGGGVPSSLITPLLIAWKLTTDRSIQKELRTLLELNISEEARRALKYPISLGLKQSPQKLASSIALLTANTEFDREELMEYLGR